MLTRGAGAKPRPATSSGIGRPSTAIGGRAAACATPLHRWAANQDKFGSDSDSPGALSEGESTVGGGGAGDAFSMAAEDMSMETNLSPRTTIVMERRLWKVCQIKLLSLSPNFDHQVRTSLNSMPAPGHVMSRLFGSEDQWRYAQQVSFIF